LVQSVATTLGVRDEAGLSLHESLVSFLRPKLLLLVLDNCEHLLAACTELTHHLLRHCPQLHILVTSRHPLNLAGETVWRVPPLTNQAALHLFVSRAQAVQPAFRLTAANTSAVAQICERLDGIPLAIEMAAVRIKALPVEQIATRLGAGFDLLTSSDRTTQSRHRTLRATLDWSYALLMPEQKTCLNRLSVFAGGLSLEAAEAITGKEMEALDLLTSLVDQSLVSYQEEGGQARYRLLETVRQYAWERLIDSGEEETLRRHRDHFLGLAETARPLLEGTQQAYWLAHLEREHDNLRGALRHCERMADGGEVGLRLTTALWQFWQMRGYIREGRDRYAVALAHRRHAVRLGTVAGSARPGCRAHHPSPGKPGGRRCGA